jgi:hypothetical protein
MILLLAAIMLQQPEFPLDQELKSSFGSNSISVELICKVTKAGDTYTYMYSMKNKGKKKISVKWETVNKAMCFGGNLDMVYELEPNENLNFILEHPDAPVYTWGTAKAFYLTNKEQFNKTLEMLPDVPKGVKMKIPNKSFLNSSSGSTNAALPLSYTK